jgi:hypothetical protein
MQKFITFTVADKYHFSIPHERISPTSDIHLYRMVNHEVNRDKRVNLFRVAAKTLHRTPHRSQIDYGGDTCEVLQNHSCGSKRDFH